MPSPDSKKNIFTEPPKFDYDESAPIIDAEEFFKVIRSRRSVRVYSNDPVPESVMRRALDAALLAPNSSNLQCWEFYWVKNPEKKAKLVEACLSQSAAKTAQELVVAVARTSTWNWARKEMLKLFDSNEKGGSKVPAPARAYYEKLVPYVYCQGPLGIWGLVKKGIVWSVGWFRVIPREPTSKTHLKIWAVKTTALACENLMLALRAQGFDSCPMEGYDSARVRRILNLSCDAVPVMVISAGKRAKGGIYGPQIRFPSEHFIKEV
ncbi:MAG: nitroreductase [Bdellovibrionales bacterium GWA2_49_15]|nr:MAG: nitroreductase [Bdellovibrionales bacterium GWA2_49_15]HAZ11828.1 nitroreductase family protein [Bdellovibrionales bacterium]